MGSAEERKKLFRRMQWTFVYGPPLLILVVSGSVGALLAWALALPGLGFWAEWAIWVVLLIAIPVIAYLIRARLNR